MALTKGDTSPDLTGTCSTELNGVVTVANITGATLALHIKKPSGTVLTKVGTIVSGVAGTWSYTWVAGDLDEAGVYEVENQVTYSNGRIQTFGPDKVAVQDQLA